MDISISPQPVPQPDLVVNKISINIDTMILGVSATFRVRLYTDNLSNVEKLVKIEGEEYLNWSNDDNYIIQLIFQKLGINSTLYS